MKRGGGGGGGGGEEEFAGGRAVAKRPGEEGCMSSSRTVMVQCARTGIEQSAAQHRITALQPGLLDFRALCICSAVPLLPPPVNSTCAVSQLDLKSSHLSSVFSRFGAAPSMARIAQGRCELRAFRHRSGLGWTCASNARPTRPTRAWLLLFFLAPLRRGSRRFRCDSRRASSQPCNGRVRTGIRTEVQR